MYGLSINFCCCSTIKTPPIFDIYILPNIGGIFYFFSALPDSPGAEWNLFRDYIAITGILLKQ